MNTYISKGDAHACVDDTYIKDIFVKAICIDNIDIIKCASNEGICINNISFRNAYSSLYK